jgi:phage FluMu protein Com
LALTASDLHPRCTQCNKLLAVKVTRPWTIMCGRCKHVNNGTDQRSREIVMEES